MASLNLSQDGPSINKTYQSVVSAAVASSSAASSPTYGQWALYTVSAPLVSAFQQDSGKESVLKVQSTGEGELADLVEDFSDGKIQYAFVKVKDPNTTLPKFVLIAWCGEGVPERTKGYFTSHTSAVSSVLHGYHVQITARTDADLTPEAIVRKVSDASGSKYSGDNAPSVPFNKPAPPVASKPVFTPTSIGNSGGFKPLGARLARAAPQDTNTDADGWGADAPQVTRTQLEKVAPAYQPTKVSLSSVDQGQEQSRFVPPAPAGNGTRPDVVKGAYEPVGKVDIAAIRRQAQESGQTKDDRPAPVKGSYEPVGKVDIAAIRARAQPPVGGASTPSPSVSPARTGEQDEPRSLVDRSAAFSQSERMHTMPKPKVANKFGSSGTSFTGTKAPLPGGFDGKPAAPSTAPVGVASKNFADEGGKTPAQIWAEKKARQRGDSGAGSAGAFPTASTINAQTSGGGGWESGYAGKKWAPVNTTHTGATGISGVSADRTGEDAPQQEEASSPSTNIGSIRDRFNQAPPPMDMSTKPQPAATRAVPPPGVPAEDTRPIPMPPPVQPRSPSPEPSSSPVRIAMPVARGEEPDELESPQRQLEAEGMPIRSLEQALPHEDDLEREQQVTHHEPARAAAQAVPATAAGEAAVAAGGGKRAVAQYDYEKAEDNEIELVEGQIVTNIDMVDDDWWLGENVKGERGLFPSNYVELIADDEPGSAHPAVHEEARAPSPPTASTATAGKTATAEYDYDAAEDNELSFPEGAKITNVSFPDEDWWLGEYKGQAGLFPANYVTLDN